MAAPRTTSFGFRFPSGVSVQNHARPEIERSSGIEIDGGSMLRTNATWVLGLILVTQAAPLSVTGLLSDPDRFNGQPVTVTGTMSNFRGNPLRRRGPVYTFDLSDGMETVHVISFQKPPCQFGAATVEGTFEQVKKMAKVSYSFEEITARSVTCLPTRRPTSK